MKSPSQGAGYEAIGSDVVVYPWNAERTQRRADETIASTIFRLTGNGNGEGTSSMVRRPVDLAFEPTEELLSFMGGSLPETRVEHRVGVSMDVFSGKLLVVDERLENGERVGGEVRIVEYV